MNVGKWFVIGVAIVLIAAAGRAAHAADGQPSRQALGEMGLGGLVAMSDDDASSVRGKGYMGGGSRVQVYGNSFATINGPNGGAHSENGYAVSGKHYAAGANGSVAGVIHVSSGGNNGGYGGGNGPTKSRMKPGGGYGGGGGGYGGGGGGYGGGIKVNATVFFAGGFSVGRAY